MCHTIWVAQTYPDPVNIGGNPKFSFPIVSRGFGPFDIIVSGHMTNTLDLDLMVQNRDILEHSRTF